ncbi:MULTISPECIES: phosphatidate cytidylyltransferase [unclassified Modicisalibacter]|uniref:phosphatidate cytidylyltransferase n=1 Tax=unclassified Modicisalibacter TaxID=2679913 RepID=UPI001CC9BC06|nr:phosphatidate cytidylyltransferase [Modicisalibacter sp. R2A 31.J]MBZ9573202.1 phosphatidate cytidylyltransferase [Modicisalibacter sp. MOD 31.J]
MLRQRIITAVILAPLVLAGLFGLSGGAFAVFTAAVILLAGWEWTNLAGVAGIAGRLGYVALLALLMLAGWYSDAVNAAWPLWVACAGWLVSIYWVAGYPDRGRQWRSVTARLAIGLWVLLPCWAGFVQLRDSGAQWLLYVLLLVWLADIGAYFAGRRFGRRKLAPRVSPGKSWEGVYGGMAVTALLALGYALGFSLSPGDGLWLVVTTVGVTLVSVLGDLLESMFKRWRGIKDSGRLLPGHGGILDRIDSLTAAVPLFALLRLWH